MAVTLTFDIGYASIGWCVLSAEPETQHPEFLGTGVVTFPTDDCLASQRRNLRRTRRHIRSTRHRIERMKRWLVHRGFIGREEADLPGDASPFFLVAHALQGGRILSALELWSVLRWYAHNRGYDGNSRWSREEADPDDTEKERNAMALMEQAPATSTMAETVCKILNIDPANPKKRSSEKPYKTLNAAFPRSVVVGEVKELLRFHLDKLEGLDAKTVRFLMAESPLTKEDRAELEAADIRLPKRYHGGLLFGQLVPRFDNRIISRCPIMWADEYGKAKDAGKSDEEARKLADKFAKVPAAKCPEFLEYRFARVLANLKADGEPLSKELRRHLFDRAKERGRFTEAELRKEIEAQLGKIGTNLEAYFKIHPDAEKQLVIDPAVVLPHSSRVLKPIWPLLGEPARNSALRLWSRGKAVCPAQLLELAHNGGDPEQAETVLREHFAKLPKKEANAASFDAFLLKPMRADYGSGRAPYSRVVLKRVVEEVLEGCDPTKPARSDAKLDGEDKSADGVLYPLMDPSSRVRELMAERPLDQLTNNHLVRHRLLILGRLLDDLLHEFEIGAEDETQVVVEVARELKEFSGMTVKQITTEMNSRLKNFKDAVAYLEDNAPNLLQESSGRGGIIRKCRIAMDLDWRCPFTGEKYDAQDLPKMEREHIIPYATRNTNALHALVLTWPEVNRMKGKRTAKQFILESAELPSREVPNSKRRLTLFTPKQYETFVEGLETRGHPDDARRKRARKALLDTAEFEDKDLGFTEGQLTQSSQLMKLAMGEIKRKFPQALVDPVPGPVTAEIRKAWKLTGTLALACPEVLDENGNVRPKDEIRGLTHLHHALDAAILALAAHYLPFRSRGKDQKGKIWQALLKRNQNDEEKRFLMKFECCVEIPKTGKNAGTVVGLRDLDANVKNALGRSLAEGRVMQHVPADRSGAKAELTTWRVLEIEGEGEEARVKLRQRSSEVKEGVRKVSIKTPPPKRAGKLIGLNPKGGHGKLKSIKGAVVIEENYGLALDPKPTIIPFFNVSARLRDQFESNGCNPFRILRSGIQIILQGQGERNGIWTIATVQASLKIDLVRPGTVGCPKKGNSVWREVAVKGLLAKGIEILPLKYTAYPSER